MDGHEPDALAEKAEATTTAAAAADAAREAPEVTALVVRAKQGDADAFAGLMNLYERRIISLGLQMGLSRDDSLDACQETFVKVFRYIGRFETGRSFFKWLYRIAIHAAYDQMRHARSNPTISLDALDPAERAAVPSDAPGLHARVESSDLAEKVRRSLDCLTRRERIIFILRDLQGIETDEIGAIMRVSQVTVRRHCMSARQKLRERLSPRRD